ncbi:hypothetical protein HMPREF0765_3530 [Sphingobacterium spiritivorum ATCC 33300]|uniref:Uncharacterized protein n=1 Tax=Sphingobacterium spiritivorum ATCC 33300 TaxID=525372 RepID=C2G1S4_SPHSI|nr:hypothetical protein HMPREF0765_3530 [Sphingobacterium spiritivorum ATCC 33300]
MQRAIVIFLIIIGLKINNFVTPYSRKVKGICKIYRSLLTTIKKSFFDLKLQLATNN